MSTQTPTVQELGGFQEAAEVLSGISGRGYSRQGVQQLWKRREGNGFPDRKAWSINGRTRMLLDMREVADWYAFPEAATVLTVLSGRLWNSSDVHHLWRKRRINRFPDRHLDGDRLAFDADDLARWFRDQRAQESEAS